MNRYNLKIDGEVMPNSYTYEELILNGIFEFDDIEVKEESKSDYTNIKSFYFPEEHEDSGSRISDFDIEDNEQAYLKNCQDQKEINESEYVINEFGEMIRKGGSSSSGRSSTQKERASSTQTYSSSSSSGDNTGWKVLLTIVAIIVFLAITFSTTGWGSLPAGPICYVVIKSIWNNNW